jgi:hypothetical protein
MNPFATVVMAHLMTQETSRNPSSRYNWKFYLIRRLFEGGYARQDVVNLFHFIDWIMRLPKELDQRLREEILQMETRTAKPYISSFARLEREEGQHASALRILIHLLTHRFAPISDELQQRLSQLTADQLEQLVDVTLSAQSLDEFVAALPAVDNAS